MKFSTQGDLKELAMALCAALVPLFVLASEIDSDEFWKGGGGITAAASVVVVYRIWKGSQEERAEKAKED